MQWCLKERKSDEEEYPIDFRDDCFKEEVILFIDEV